MFSSVCPSSSGLSFSKWLTFQFLERHGCRRSKVRQVGVPRNNDQARLDTHANVKMWPSLFLNARPFVRFIATARPKAGR